MLRMLTAPPPSSSKGIASRSSGLPAGAARAGRLKDDPLGETPGGMDSGHGTNSLADSLLAIAKEKQAVSVTVCQGGPYLLRGSFTVLDERGEPLPRTRQTVALCRCGRSRQKPLCDGSHKAGGPWETPGTGPAPAPDV